MKGKVWSRSYLVSDDPDFFRVESLVRLRVQTLSPPSVEVIDVDDAGVSPRLLVKLQWAITSQGMLGGFKESGE